jgi:hypothetical protein
MEAGMRLTITKLKTKKPPALARAGGFGLE